MKKTQVVLVGIAFVFAISFISRAQTSAEIVQLTSVRHLLQAADPITFLPLEENGDSGGSGKSYGADTNLLFLEITNVASGTVYLNLHNPTNQIYAIWGATNLLAVWNVETEVWPTDTNCTPFTVPTRDRPNLFLQAEDWTGVDENSNGIPDWWEFAHFGFVGVDPNADPDGDGLSNLQEYQNGTDPNDYYNGNLPDVTIVSGNYQSGLSGQLLPEALTVKVADSNATILANAPVAFTVNGGGLTAVPNGVATNNFLQLRTGGDGEVSAWFRLPAGAGTNFVAVQAQSGSNTEQIVFAETGRISPAMAIGAERIMLLTADGDVVSRGGNYYSELGDYTHLDSSDPVHVASLANVVKIAAGMNHALAIDASGKLWAWGNNDSGQLGDGGGDASNLPLPVRDMTNAVVAIAGGYSHSVAVKADGTVWTWGQNWAGQLGDGNTVNTNIPVHVEGLTNAVAVAAGFSHTLALLGDGTVWAWGDDSFNQLGDGNGKSSSTPVPVPGLSGITAIYAGGNHNLALDTNGNVWACGSYTLNGGSAVIRPLDGTSNFKYADEEGNGNWPVMVAGLTNVVSLAVGASHCLALDKDGNVWAWGDARWGQLGDGGPANNGGQYSIDIPLPVAGVTNIVAIAAGSDASVALDVDGRLWQWGISDNDGKNWAWGDENGLPALAPGYDDFYKGQKPGLEILNGNHQTCHASLEFGQPMVIQVTDTNGVALSNAPVSVEVIAGDMELRIVSGGDNYKGLRLTTDANGEVSLIGYADRYLIKTNCLVRVLAASREQVVEADFNETLVALPTISITSPTNGDIYLIGTNQTLAITVDVKAVPGGSIQEVDYYYGTNGTADTLLGVFTQSPYSIIWTNSLWWTNAFVSQYSLKAVAVDDAGAQSDPQNVTFTIALDSDDIGIPDYWQLQYFGYVGVDPNADPDGDGLSNLQEYQKGTAPTDYYNGNLPTLELLGGNDQSGMAGLFLPSPVTMEVEQVYPSVLLTNAPLTFTVTSGTALLAATTNDIPVKSITLWTGTNGRVSAWVYFPPASSNPPDSTIIVSASSEANSTTVTVNEFVPLGHWTFNDTDTWIGEEGQLPLLTDNLAGIPGWSRNAVLVDSANPASLAYRVVETNGNTNITCQTGSVRFWFKPDWSSADRGGAGPGAYGRLIEMGSYNPAFTNGWWSLYLSPDGTQIFFATSTNGGGMTNLATGISWVSNEWYQIALTYSPDGSALHVDGQRLANGAGVNYFPNADELNNGFRIGSDQDGNNQAEGAFDELETFDYPLAGDNTCTHASDIPDWWEIYYFSTNGIDLDASFDGYGYTILWDYENRYLHPTDANPLQFVLNLPIDPVTTNQVNGTITVLSGLPAYMAVLQDDTNRADAVWQPYSSNVVVNLNRGNDIYHVLVGLRAARADAPIIWHSGHVALHLVPLTLTITNPVGGTVSQPMIQVQGFANEALGSLTFDVSNAAGVFTNQTGYRANQAYNTNLLAFTTNYFQCYDVSLANGLNIITIHATDLDGNTTETNLNVTLDYSGDTTSPVFSVLWPPDGAQISGSQFTLQGQVDDATASITAVIVDAHGDTNTVQGLVERDGTVWVNHLPLAGGANTLTVTATDAAGNASIVNLTLYQSSILVTMNPLSSGQLYQSSVSVSGTVSDPMARVYVNGVQATVNSDGTWSADNVPVNADGPAVFHLVSYPAATIQTSQKSGVKASSLDTDEPGLQLAIVAQEPVVEVVDYSKETAGSGYDYTGSSFAFYLYWYFEGRATIEWVEGIGGSWYNYSSRTPTYWSGWTGPAIVDESEGAIPAEDQTFPMEYGTIPDGSVNSKTALKTGGVAVEGVNNLYLVKVQARDEANRVIDPAKVKIPGYVLEPCPDDPSCSEFLVRAPGGATVTMTPTAPASYYSWSFQAVQLNMQLAVDANRDGAITFDQPDQSNPDKTSASEPYRFWINDSKESGDDESAGGADDQIPGQSYFNANYSLTHVNGRSDLVNFFPVTLCLSNVLQWIPPTNGWEYRLVQNDSAIKFVYTSLTPTNAFDYLTNTVGFGYGTNSDEWVTNADTIQVRNTPGTVLDTNWLAQVRNNGGNGVILVEGCVATTQPLMLEIWHMGQNIGSVPLYLSISGVEHMFRHYNMCAYGNGTVDTGNPGNPSRYDAPNEPVTNGKNLVFLHGYNVNQQQARGVESEMFKRFNWSGSKARFYGVTWNGAESQITSVSFTPNYHTNVVNALQTAPHLASFLNGLSGETTVAAHSLGNMVVLSAINDCNVTAIKHYFMIDAAVPIEALQGNAVPDPYLIYPDWILYANRLYASDWWQLFPISDARSTLTWSNRLGSLGGVDIYNFYSSGEEILRENTNGAPPSEVGITAANIGYWLQDIYTDNHLPIGCYGWQWQEMLKGRGGSDTWVGSTHGGWKFNDYWRDPYGYLPLPSAMNDTAASILQDYPMFSIGSTENGTPDQDLLWTDASVYAQVNRDRILSDAIPALTLPVGANHVDKFAPQNGDDKNFNMQASFETDWPAMRLANDRENNNWHHSDFDYVAYPFTHKLFDEIVNDGDLKKL